MEKTLEQAEKEFQDWLKTIQIPEEKYYVLFDEQGKILELSSNYSPEKIEIDKDIALSIYDGSATLKSYRVNVETFEIEKNTELICNDLTKIDDVLHRVIEKKWSNVSNPDITIRYDSKNESLIFSANKKHRNFVWSGDTILLFLITGYNDPNVLKEMVQVTVGDLLENQKKVKIKTSGKFSIYTRRVFRDYIFEAL